MPHISVDSINPQLAALETLSRAQLRTRRDDPDQTDTGQPTDGAKGRSASKIENRSLLAASGGACDRALA